MTSSKLAMRREGPQSLVIGAGQAGLVVGYQLRQRGLPFQIVDAGAEIGEVWRKRWDSLKLFTPAQYDALPGMDFPAAPGTYPGKDAVADFLHAYATRFELPVSLNTRVTSLRNVDGAYLAETEGGTLEARNVVIATGPFQVPRVPPIADRLDDGVLQFHSSAYHSPQGITQGPVLVVGGGNTGFQIAEELAGHIEVHLAIGSRQTPLPQRILGRDLFWYLEATGLIHKSLESRIGQRLSSRDTLIGSSPRAIRRHGVKLHPRAVDAAGSTVSFSNETKLDVGTVIWATGFRSDYSWIDVPVFGDGGEILHDRGVTESPGLYFLGLSWQYTRGSALLGWVKDDAEYIAEQISASRPAGETEARQPAIAR
ncbi:MAG TPA: NAD(P)-binding domain-containing protein [Solirubrobacterales bacterium]|nr:NAD(P)-binding domain-containing protein [Solirubrobacterales bacterium]